MRITKMTTLSKMLQSFSKCSHLVFQGNTKRSVWRISKWILGIKGLIISVLLYLVGREAWRHDPESNRATDGIVQSV